MIRMPRRTTKSALPATCALLAMLALSPPTAYGAGAGGLGAAGTGGAGNIGSSGNTGTGQSGITGSQTSNVAGGGGAGNIGGTGSTGSVTGSVNGSVNSVNNAAASSFTAATGINDNNGVGAGTLANTPDFNAANNAAVANTNVTTGTGASTAAQNSAVNGGVAYTPASPGGAPITNTVGASLTAQNFTAIDANHDGRLSRDEMNRFTFKSGDLNGNGIIDANEWNGFQPAIAVPAATYNQFAANGALTQAQYDNLIARSDFYKTFDTNNDGVITQAEYQAGIAGTGLSGNAAATANTTAGTTGSVTILPGL
jgi:hypothetical protein